MKQLLLIISIFFSIVVAAQTPYLGVKGQDDGPREKSSSGIFQVYPNPSSGDITVDLGQGLQKGQLKLYTINGSEVLRQEIYSLEKVDISHLRDGFYFYEIISEGKLLYVGRVIKK